MPKLRHTSAIGSPSRSRATNRKRSSTTEHSFHGINTSGQRAKSVTHVSGTKCHPCLGPFSAESQTCPLVGRRVIAALETIFGRMARAQVTELTRRGMFPEIGPGL